MAVLAKKNVNKTKAEGEFAEYVYSLDCASIGSAVYGDGLDESMLSDITAVCRRAFKKKNIVVYVELDSSGEEYEEGIVFTTDSIFNWTDSGSNITGISYSSITKVDYDETDIIIEHEGKTTTISLGADAEDEKYPRHMYSFIMDILEYLESNEEE